MRRFTLTLLAMLVICLAMPGMGFATDEDAFDDQEAVQLFNEYRLAHPEIPANASFGGWPLEGKQYFTEVIRPVVLQNYAAHAQQIYTQTHLLAASQFLYGMPDDQALSQEQVMQIAQNALTDNFGVPQEWLCYYDLTCLFYDITNPDQPLWKISITAIGNYQAVQSLIDNPYTVYKVEMDARTGAITDEYSFNPKDNDGTLAFAAQYF